MPFLSSGQTRTGAPGVSGGTPLYVPNTGNQIAGVLSLNGQSGLVSITSSDNALAVSGAGGAVDLRTTGQAIPCASLTASGAVSAGSVVSSGAVSGTTATFSGKVLATSGGLATASTPTSSLGFLTSGAIALAPVPNGQDCVITALQALINCPAPGVFDVAVWNTQTVGAGISPTAQFTVVAPGTNGSAGATGYAVSNIVNTAGFTVTLTGATAPFGSAVLHIQNSNGSATYSDLFYSFTRRA